MRNPRKPQPVVCYSRGYNRRMTIVDAQIHLWEAHRPDRPWLPEFIGQKIGPTHRAEPLEAPEMLSMMDSAGVDRAIIVPPSVCGDDNLTGLEAAQKHPTRFAVMGRFNPQASDASERLETWLTQPGMLGIRLTFHKPQWIPWLDDGSLDWFWDGCERLRIPVMAYLPYLLDKVPAIAERHPGLLLILDHMACPSGKLNAEAFNHFDKLIPLNRFPNVAVKTTCVPSYTTDPYPFPFLKPYLRRVYDAFGPKRLMWGSDVSKLNCTYRESLDHFQYDLAFLGAEDKRWILGETAATLLRWH